MGVAIHIPFYSNGFDLDYHLLILPNVYYQRKAVKENVIHMKSTHLTDCINYFLFS